MARASHGVPGRVHEVVSEWARDEAGRRLAAAAEWLAEGRGRRSADLEFANNVIGLKLGRLYRGEGEAPAADSGCPYKGLASFEEDDAASFFGRERLVGELAARTVQVGLLGVLGASGSGKSSVVAAGLLPSLDAGLLPGSDRWRHVVFRPGEHPQEALTAALAAIAPPSGGGDPVEATIEAVGSDGRLVVAIDQFEEVFTLCADEREREAFIGAITRTVSRSPERIVFVLTIRDDFYGRCAPYRDLAELLVANHVLVPPMTSDELRRAIELPARRTRLRVEAALADALVAEAEGEPGALPLLSAALVELWQARDDGWLRVGTYERTGGLRGAVARLAEASYRQLSDGERDMARRICLRLAGIGDGEVVTRRRVELSEFDVDTNPVAADVLARLTRDRLLTITDSTVEVAHEALLREWPRLRGWLEEDLQGHQLRQHLTQAAKQWEGRRRDTSEMYRGARLSAALDWASTRGPDLNELERDFLAASREASEREAERQRRTNRRLRGLLVGTALFLVVALVAGALALVQRGRARGETERAEKQAQIASARELAAASVANLEVDPERSILLALEAVDATWEADRTVEPEAEEALHRALIESRVVLTVPQGGGLAVSPDGERFATTGEDGTTTVRDAATGRALMTLEAHRGAVTDVEFSPDGDLLATTGGDGAVRLWDSEHGRQLQALRAGGEPVLNTAFSPDGNRLATLEAGVLRLWDVPAGTQRVLARAPAGGTFDVFVPPGPPAFSPDGSLVASATWDGSAKIWDVATGKTKLVVTNPVWFITDVALSPDGRYLLSGSPDGTARMWSASSGDLVSTFSGHTGEVRAIGFSPDGSRIATGSSEGIARVWDAATGELLMSLAGHTDTIDSLAFTPDGRELLTAAIDGTTRLWDVSLAGGRDWLTVPGPSLRLGGFAFSPGGRTFAVPGDISGVTIRDVQTGRRIVTLRGSNAKVTQVAFSPDGRRLAVAAGSGLPPPRKADTTVPIWDVETGEMLMVLRGHDDVVNGVAFSPDGSRLATASYDETVRVWDTTSGEMLEKLDMEGGGWAVAFSPDGRSLLGTDEQLEEPAVVVWDVDTFRQIGRFTGHSDVVQDIGFGPGGRVVTAGWDGQAMIWDLDSRRELLTLRGRGGAVLDAVFSPDGTRVATGTFDGTATIWDAGTGRKLFTLFGHERLVHTVAFSPDGRFLATASGDGTVTLYLLAIDELRALAGRRVTRLLTDDECLQYLHVASCPQGS
jgi:WD40 repeat protein